MSAGGKIVLGFLVIVAIAFGVILFLSRRENGEGAGLPSPENAPKWIENLSGRLVDERRLAYRETRAPCKRAGAYVLEPGAACSIEIPSSDVPVRELALLVEGASARLELVQPGSVPHRKTVEGGQKVVLRVFEDEATLHASCPGLGGGGCTLRPL